MYYSFQFIFNPCINLAQFNKGRARLSALYIYSLLTLPKQTYWHLIITYPDSKVQGANMGPIWGRQDPGGPHVGPMNFVIWVVNFHSPMMLRYTQTKMWSFCRNLDMMKLKCNFDEIAITGWIFNIFLYNQWLKSHQNDICVSVYGFWQLSAHRVMKTSIKVTNFPFQ